MKSPRGGQYNDGFEILGELKFSDARKLLSSLDIIGVNYIVHEKQPEVWCPPPFCLGGKQLWIEYENSCECFGYRAHITIGTCSPDFSIVFNFNSASWFDVSIEDVKRAAAFVDVLATYGFL